MKRLICRLQEKETKDMAWLSVILLQTYLEPLTGREKGYALVKSSEVGENDIVI